MKKRVLRKSILTSLVLLMSMATVLVGTSLAWFNVTVVNEGNIIQSGDLKVEFLASDNVGFSDSKDLSGVSAPIFKFDAAAQPGDSIVQYLKVTNKGSIKLAYQVAFSATDTGLGDAIQIEIEGVSPVVASKTVIGSAISAESFSGVGLEKNDSETYMITMTYDSNTEIGTYADKASFSMNILLLAWQSKYDASKPILVSNLGELQNAALTAVKGQQIVLNKDIVAPEKSVAFSKLVNLNLGGNKLELDAFSVTSTDVGYMNFANGTLKVDTYTIDTPNAEVNHAATFTVDAGETFITTSKTSYKLFGILNTKNLNILGVSVVRPQAGSKILVSGGIDAPAASVVPNGAATIIIKGAADGVVTESFGANVVTNANIVVVGEFIQDAIDAAAAGTIIYVAPGEFKEELKINKPIKLIGSGIGQTFLSAKDDTASHIIKLGNNTLSDLTGTSIEGFTVNSPIKSIQDISSIYLLGHGSKDNEIIIKNNEFLGNGNRQGIAILSEYSEAIRHIKIQNNTFNTLKYSMYFNSLSDVEISNNVLKNTRYSGIVFAGNNAIPIENVKLLNNQFLNIATETIAYDLSYHSGVAFQHYNIDTITLSDNTFELANGNNLNIYYAPFALNGKVVVRNETQLRDAIADVTLSEIIFGSDIEVEGVLNLRRKVILNGDGYKLTSTFNGVSTPSAIKMDSLASDSVIKNLIVHATRYTDNVIYVSTAKNVTISNNTLTSTDNLAMGINFDKDASGSVTNNSITGRKGIGAYLANEVEINNNNITFSEYGLELHIGTTVNNETEETAANLTFVSNNTYNQVD